MNGKTYTYYRATQEQRKREIRALKREESALSAAGLTDQAKEKRALIQARTADYEDFSRDVEIRPKNERLRVCEAPNTLTSGRESGIISMDDKRYFRVLNNDGTEKYSYLQTDEIQNFTSFEDVKRYFEYRNRYGDLKSPIDISISKLMCKRKLPKVLNMREERIISMCFRM